MAQEALPVDGAPAGRRWPVMFELFGQGDFRAYWIATFFYFLVFGRSASPSSCWCWS
ncbi:MAG: hypothetical protein U5Q44_16645 [Dehalococcoidia bacterium]|nr:hypothetical protein [Dehalococcoidia bacterium]